MDEEIEELLKNSKDISEENWKEFIFYKANLFNKEVVIVKSGAGKVFASMICQKIIDNFNPECIIFTGVAGALNKNLEVGDVVISKDCVHHDMDATALGFSRGTILFTDYKEFESDIKLRELAKSTKLNNHKIIEGRMLTGDQFINANIPKYFTEELKGDTVDMESAAIAQVATINKIPFIIIRTISDKSNDSANTDFKKFLSIVAKNSNLVVKNVLENI